MTADNPGALVPVFQGNDGIHTQEFQSMPHTSCTPDRRSSNARTKREKKKEKKKQFCSEFGIPVLRHPICRCSERSFIFITHQILQIYNQAWEPSVAWQRNDTSGNKQAANSEVFCHISSLHSGKVCPCLLYSVANMKVSFSFLIPASFPKLSWGMVSLLRNISFIYLGFWPSRLYKAISPGDIVCHVGCAAETLCKLGELTLSTSLPPVSACLWSPSWHGCDAGMRRPSGSCQCHTKPSIHISATVTADRAPPATASQTAAWKYVNLV